MKKSMTLMTLMILLCSGCAASVSIGPSENPYGDAHIEITERNSQN